MNEIKEDNSMEVLKNYGWSFGVPLVHLGRSQFCGEKGDVLITASADTMAEAQAKCIAAVWQFEGIRVVK